MGNHMKVGIITITDGANYGNRLQNYAMQELIKSTGCSVVTFRRKSPYDLNKLQKVIMYLKNIGKTVIGRENTTFYKNERKARFERFNKEFISFSSEILGDNRYPTDIDSNYDYFICGSDQIWNARFEIIQADINNYLAMFASPNKRISYAASFGTNDLFEKYEDLFTQELKKFKSIGVREESGLKIIEKYCDRRDAEMVLDPTLMLLKDKWIKIEKKPLYDTEKYVLTYFLGGRSEKILKHAIAVAKKHNAMLINLDGEFLADCEIENKDHYLTSPEEFIWLINHSECVLTDSFHAVAFSLIFNKLFCVYERKSTEVNNDMGTRIDSLLRIFDLIDHKDNIDNPQKFPMDYDKAHVEEVFIKERKRSLNFLEMALENSEKI